MISSSVRWRWAAFGLGLLPVLLGLRHGFFADDLLWLETSQRSVHSFSTLLSPWAAGYFRPIAQVVFFLEFLVYRFHPLYFNLTGLALHAGVGVCLWRLANGLGLSERQSALAVLFFLVGAGHFTKPVAWACSQGILLGAVFMLLAARLVLSPHPSARRGRDGPVCFLFATLAMFTHDLYALLPLLLGISLVLLRHRWWRGYLTASLGLTILYVWISLHARAGMELEHAFGWHLLGNLLQYGASLVGPFCGLPVLEGKLQSAGLPRAALLLVPAVVRILGCLVLVAVLWGGWRLGRPGVASLILAGGLLLPAISITGQGGWVNARYAYPSAAIFCVLLSKSMGLFTRRRGLWFACVFSVIWYLSLFCGSVYMQKKAIGAGAADLHGLQAIHQSRDSQAVASDRNRKTQSPV